MPRTTLAPVFATLCIAAAPAAAQVTAEDVWSATVDAYARLGVALDGTLARDGAVVTVDGLGGEYLLPLDLGRIAWEVSDLTLTEGADGSVSSDWGGSIGISLVAEITEAPDFYLTGEFVVDLDGWTSVTRGTPDNMLTETRFDMMTLEARNLSATGPDGFADGAVTVFMLIRDSSTQTRTVGGEVMTLDSTGSLGEVIADFGFAFDGMESRSVSQTLAGTYNTNLTLPSVPLDLINLGPALRAGFGLVSIGESGESVSQTVTRLDGELMSDQSQRVESVSQRLSLSAAGLEVQGTANGIENIVSDMMFGSAPFTVTIAAATGRLDLPLLSGRGPEDASLMLSLADLSVGDDLWATLGLPGAELNAPATLSVGTSVRLELLRDLTDILDLAENPEAVENLVRLFSASLDRLSVRYGDAELTGTGQVGWGEAGEKLGPMMNPPTGEARFALTGAYALLDRLAASGVLTGEMAMAARAGLAGFGKPVGQDRLESTVVFGPNGEVTVNGAPIPF